MSEKRDVVPELVIPSRPQISVVANDFGEIAIGTVAISDDYRHVEMQDVLIPVGDAQEVIDAMQRLVYRVGGGQQ